MLCSEDLIFTEGRLLLNSSSTSMVFLIAIISLWTFSQKEGAVQKPDYLIIFSRLDYY